MNWFEGDKEGLAGIVDYYGKPRVLAELVSNALDAGATEISVSLRPIPNVSKATLVVEDNSEEGFTNLSHAYTLFAISSRKNDPSKRGRFNLGEKLVLSICDEATITSTSGTIVFDGNGRTESRKSRNRGTEFHATIRLTRVEVLDSCKTIKKILVPSGSRLTINGEKCPPRKAKYLHEAPLPTEIFMETAEGKKRTIRKTVVEIHQPVDGEVPMLYEMGIPVVDLVDGERFHINILQKIPLNMNRDNVTPAFLAQVQGILLEALGNDLTAEDATQPWALTAANDPRTAFSAVERFVEAQYGPKYLAGTPGIAECDNRARSDGYTVIPARALTKNIRDRLREAGKLKSTSQMFPQIKLYSSNPDAPPAKVVPFDEWWPSLKKAVPYIIKVASGLLDRHIEVIVVEVRGSDAVMAFDRSRNTIHVNIAHPRMSERWFEAALVDEEPLDDLILHECAHFFTADHTSDSYHEGCTLLGAKLKKLYRSNPKQMSMVG